MMEFRWLECGNNKKLQVRVWFYPVMIASGDIVLRELKEEESKWQTIPTEKQSSRDDE